MTKRLICAALALVMVLSLLPACALAAETSEIYVGEVAVTSANAADFSDVPGGAWYASSVRKVVACGWMDGVGENRFAPNTIMTRAMVVTVLYRAAGSPQSAAKADFADVSPQAWCADAVSWAAETGIVTGFSTEEFGPNDPVTRQQVVAILWRFCGTPDYGSSVEGFADGSLVSVYAHRAMAWAVAEGIIGGIDGKLQPRSNTTRAQFAAILSRLPE